MRWECAGPRRKRDGPFRAGDKPLPVDRRTTDGRIELKNANFQHDESKDHRQFCNEFARAGSGGLQCGLQWWCLSGVFDTVNGFRHGGEVSFERISAEEYFSQHFRMVTRRQAQQHVRNLPW